MTNDLPSVGTEDAQALADRFTEGDFYCPVNPVAATMLRALVSERDALAGRVRELELNARRYEWLRKSAGTNIQYRLNEQWTCSKFMLRLNELDAAIDAALTAQEQSK